MKKNITVVISNHCNMDTVPSNGCSYCCIQNRNTSKVLNFDDVDEFVKMNVIPLKDNVNFFEFFGGEPTLHFDVINRILEKYPEYNYRMYTNGLFDFEKWKDTLILFKEVLISHDGPGLFNSKRGIGNNFEVTRQCEENISNCMEYGIPISIAIVPSTEKHYDNLDEVISFFYEKFSIRSFSLEIPSVIQDFHVNTKFSSVHFNKIIDFFFSDTVSKFLKLPIEDRYILNIPKEHYPGQLNTSNCSDTNLALSPNGKIYHCRDTAANENNLIKDNKITFFTNVDEIKKIEKTHTCHVKKMQGYDYSFIVGDDNNLYTRMMYSTISLMNKFYYDYLDSDFDSCEKSFLLIEEFSIFYKLLKDKE